MAAPLRLAEPSDGSGRLFILDQKGTLEILQGGLRLSPPLLDAGWDMIDQPNLTAEVASAPSLKTEDLGGMVKATRLDRTMLALNPDG